MMSLANFKNMDPFILLSAVNMQLRDEYSSLDELCATNDIDNVTKLVYHFLRQLLLMTLVMLLNLYITSPCVEFYYTKSQHH